jgi:hypothetical protein
MTPPPPPDASRYAAKWRAYRLRARLGWGSNLAIPVACVASAKLGSAVPLILVAVACVAARWPVARWTCPRCGNPFFQFVFYSNPFAQRCVHCGLPKWSTDPGAPDTRSGLPPEKLGRA